MYKITDIIPFMRAGWAAMDENGYYRWFLRKPYVNEEFGVWRTDISCSTCSLKCFDIAPADDWTKSLIRIDNDKREKLKEEFNNNIQKVLSND